MSMSYMIAMCRRKLQDKKMMKNSPERSEHSDEDYK